MNFRFLIFDFRSAIRPAGRVARFSKADIRACLRRTLLSVDSRAAGVLCGVMMFGSICNSIFAEDLPEAAPATQPAEEVSTSAGAPPAEATPLDAAAELLGDLGTIEDEVYTIVSPRDDVELRIDGNAVPAAAGLESRIHVWNCPCGKLNASGQFLLLEYEVNDVIAALQKEGVKVAAVAPAFIEDRPRLYIVRFQAEGFADTIVPAIKDSLNQIGPRRLEPLE